MRALPSSISTISTTVVKTMLFHTCSRCSVKYEIWADTSRYAYGKIYSEHVRYETRKMVPLQGERGYSSLIFGVFKNKIERRW